MAVMRRLLVTTIAAAALAGASAAPASADVLSDLGVSTEGLVNLPAGFDPLNFDPLAIDMAIGIPKPVVPVPIDMTTKWMPTGKPLTAPSRASKKASKRRKKSRRARRGS